VMLKCYGRGQDGVCETFQVADRVTRLLNVVRLSHGEESRRGRVGRGWRREVASEDLYCCLRCALLLSVDMMGAGGNL